MISAIDTHTEGMPTRVIIGGIPAVPGRSMSERRTWAMANLDDLRGLLMREPHGHAAMSGAILQPALRSDADWGVLFIETTGFLPMCGHGTIGVATALVETGMVEVTEPHTVIRLDTPAGPVAAEVAVSKGRAQCVTLTNVPAFVLEPEAQVTVPGWGEVSYAMVFGGNFYPILDARRLGVTLDPTQKNELIGLGLRIIAAINDQRPPQHPAVLSIRGIHHAQFIEPGMAGADTRNAVLNVPGYFDRSPCGTGTSAILALRHFRGELAVGDRHVNESMLGTRFTATILSETQEAGYPAIVPQISGRAWVTGTSQHYLDPTDPFPAGFTI